MGEAIFIALPWDRLASGVAQMSRVLAFAMVAPVFGSQGVPLRVRAAFALAFTLALAPVLPAAPPGSGLIAATAGNVVVGLALGFCAKLVIDAALFAGAIAGFSSGLALANLLDPVTQLNSPTLGVFYRTLALLVFVGIGGHLQILAVLARSYEAVPAVAFRLDGAWPAGVVAMTGSVLAGGVRIAAPLLVTALMVDLCLALIARAVPQMHVLIVGAPIRLGAGLLAVAMSLFSLGGFVESELADRLRDAVRVLIALAG